MSIIGGLLAFLSSEAGQSLIALVIAALAAKYIKGNKRAETIAKLWSEAFEAAEKMGLLNKLPGSKKWLAAVKFVSDALLAAGLGPLSAKEMEVGKQAAERYGWLSKDVKAALGGQLNVVK